MKSIPSATLFATTAVASLFLGLLLLLSPLARAAVTGSISGTVRDSSGAVIAGVAVEVRNMETGVTQTVVSNDAGFYNFTTLPVGHYTVSFHKDGFQGYRASNQAIDVDTALRVDAVLQVGTTQQEITVAGSAVTVNTENAQNGEVIGGKEIASLPLNGRAYTDLLALQPGVVPINVQMYGSLTPSGNLDSGILSMSGQRDMNNGFMVNGANTVEGRAGGATIVPNLDSIAEFRIITSNAGAEYGNYAGGQVNVATKSGTNEFHGDVFEFLRNSDFDARNFFSPTRGILQQNQFGGTFGGPILRNKLFFFVDYQGTRQNVGVDTGNILVPSAQEREGNLSDVANQLTGTVNGAYWAQQLSQKLGYGVTAGEPYYVPGCTSPTTCVFPNAIIPKSAWSAVSTNILSLIPLPNSGQYFSTSSNPSTLQDDKGAIKIDTNTRWGMLSGYYFDDPWVQANPYNPGWAGSTVPGFPNQTEGKGQLVTLGFTTSFGPSMVNEFNFSYMRAWNISGLSATNGPTLSSIGFAPPEAGGLYQVTSTYPNYPQFSLNNYTLGAYNSIISQYDNTYQWQDGFTKVVGAHTLKFGADYHLDQVDIAHPNNGGNGIFGFSGGETGYDFADLLIGAPSYFYQGAEAQLELRGYYIGIYGEDSWRVTHNLTVNYGVRWEATPYWADSKNRNPDLILGLQSQMFPGAPTGYVFPGDPGVPAHFTHDRWNNFGPRIGLAYSPSASSGFLHWLFGDAGKSAIRAGYGVYYTNIQGAATFNFAAPPYGLFYGSPAPPILDTPFITRATGQNLGQRFPVPLPPSGTSASNPDSSIDWTQFLPISGMEDPLIDSKTPYAQHLTLSIQRQFSNNTLLSLSYVGTLGRHLIVDVDNNPGNAALCMSVSQPSQVVAGVSTCGPFGENGVYYPAGGGVINGTRGPFGPNFQGNAYFMNRATSSYNALEVSLRQTAGRAQFLLAYTYSKAIDDGSGFGDQALPSNYDLFRALSVFDLTHNFSISYTYELPFDKLFRADNRLTRGWRISGITSYSTGVPVSISEPDDRSLLGSTGTGPQSGSTDEPNFTPGTILADTNPRDAQPYFNTSLFSQEPLGGQGTSSRRFFHGPGMANWNLSLLKDVKLHESIALQFRAEFFNVFNHAQFYSSVNGDFNSGPGSFGMVTSAAAPRIGQLALKLTF